MADAHSIRGHRARQIIVDDLHQEVQSPELREKMAIWWERYFHLPAGSVSLLPSGRMHDEYTYSVVNRLPHIDDGDQETRL